MYKEMEVAIRINNLNVNRLYRVNINEVNVTKKERSRRREFHLELSST